MSNNKDKMKNNAISSTNALQFKSSQRSKIHKNKQNNEGIAKSKQLEQKLKTNRSSSKSSLRTAKNNEQRLCGNGKAMPSLADLEKMFDDSDDDAEQTKVNNNTNVVSLEAKPDICSTPVITEDKLKSPDTIKKIADKMLEFISNLPDPVVLLDEGPPPPVIPQKKRKKSGIPYIVGNKDRPQVPSKPTTSFCKGDSDYGVNLNDVDTDEDEHPKQRAKRTKTANYSKSIFNASSDEIAASLKELDDAQSDGSSDSNKTVAYEYFSPITCGRPQSFSPLPSTSKDNETILKNDIRFNESFAINQSISEDNDLEIINQPSELILEDSTDVKTLTPQPAASSSEYIVINDSTASEIINDNVASNLSQIECVDDTIEIIENNSTNIDVSAISVDDYYCSLDLSPPNNSDVIEVIDVDDVIAENKSVIEKYCKSNYTNHVTLVDTMPSNNTEAPVISVNIDESTVEPTEQEVLSPSTNILPARLITNTGSQNTSPNHNSLTTTRVPTNHNVTDIDRAIRNCLNVNTNTASVMLQCNKQNCNSYEHPKETMCIFSLLKSMNEMAKKCHNNINNLQQVVSSHTPTRTETNPSQMSKGLGDCPICMESLLNVPVASTICGHIFCMRCISAAVRVSGKRCPTCRKPLKGKGFHQLFL